MKFISCITRQRDGMACAASIAAHGERSVTIMLKRLNWGVFYWLRKTRYLFYVCWLTGQSVLTDQFNQRALKDFLSFSVWPLLSSSAAERGEDAFERAGFFGISLSTFFLSATIIWKWLGSTSYLPKRLLCKIKKLNSAYYLFRFYFNWSVQLISVWFAVQIV